MKCVEQSLVMVSLIFSILVISTNASAVGLEYYGVELTINDDLSVDNMVVLNFDTPINKLEYSLDFEIDGLEYESSFDLADCEVENSNGGSTVSCTFIGMTEENNQLTLNFKTRDAVKEIDGNYRFTVNYGIPLPIEHTFVLIRIPQNNILAGAANESFFPNSGSTLTDGRRIMVFWESDNLETGENLQFSILFTRPAFTGDLMGMIIYIVAVAAIVVIVLGVFYFRKRGNKVALVKSVLNRDEKRIIDILNDKGGKAGQKVLVRETDFSKAKVSRIVKSLRERGILDTKPISGRENMVMINLGKERQPRNEAE
jgi:uncharacterized membrane protein